MAHQETHFPGITRHARLLGYSRLHLWHVLTGKRPNADLVSRYKALLKTEGRPIPPALTTPQAFTHPSYLILGLAANQPVNLLYHRKDHPEDLAMLTHHIGSPIDRFPDLTPVSFPTPEAAIALIAAEIQAGSNWTYAILPQ